MKKLSSKYFLTILTLITIIVISIYSLFVFFQKDELECYSNKKYSKAELAYFKAELEYYKTRDPKTGEIPAHIRAKELEFLSSIPDRSQWEFANLLNYGEKQHIPLLQSQEWSSSGPVNIAGRMKDIAFHIEDEQIILAASASGGLWRSVNGANSWIKTSSPYAEQSIYCIEQDSREGRSNIWYYGTGELLSTTDRKFNTFARTVGMGNGIYKSTDNGLNWEHLSSTKVLDYSRLSETFQAVWDIKVDNSINDKDVVYAACHGAVMRTTNGGESWEVSIGDVTNKCFSTDFEINSDYSMYYAALSSMTSNGNKPLNTGIYRSLDGENWIDITPQGFPEVTRVIKIKTAPSNGNVLYVLTETPIKIDNPFYAFTASEHTFWKYTFVPSNNRGIWENRTNNLPYQDMGNINKALTKGFNSLGGYCFTMSIKPDDEDVVFIGGTNLFRSTNGFADTLQTTLIGGYGTYLHPDQHAIKFLPSNPKVLYNCSDGGITVTNDCFENNVKWTEKNFGLLSSQFYSVALDHGIDYDDLMIGGLQDQGTAMKIKNAENEWRQIFGGDGLSCYIAKNREFCIVTMYDGYIFGGHFINDNQVNITYNSNLASNEVANQSFNFFTLFDVEPNNNDELYLVAKNVVYRKTKLKTAINDYSQRNLNWSKMLNSALPFNESITAIKLSTTPANRLYYGSDAGKVYRIDGAKSGNPSKLEITGSSFPINGYVSCIAVDPKDADKLFVVFSNYNVQSIFYSSNGGANWTVQGGNLEENPDGGGAGPSIRWIEILNREDGTIYFAGTTTGLYSTTNLAGANTVWVKESPDLIGNIRIDMITARQSDGFVAVATQGNGIYSTFVKKINNITGHNFNQRISVFNYPNPCRDYTIFEFEILIDSYCVLKLYDVNGNLIDKVIEKYYKKGKHRFEFDTQKLSSGNYYYVLESKDYKIFGKMAVTK